MKMKREIKNEEEETEGIRYTFCIPFTYMCEVERRDVLTAAMAQSSLLRVDPRDFSNML